MKLSQVCAGVYRIALGYVNAYLIDHEGLTLVDTGLPGGAKAILRAIDMIGKRPEDLGAILLTHLHVDHTGSLAALKKATGATLYMHAADSVSFEQGVSMRPVHAIPGLFTGLMAGFLSAGFSPKARVVTLDHALRNGESLPHAGGMRVVHAPGHTAGHCAFLWPGSGGVLFSGDACDGQHGLNLAPFYENLDEGRATLDNLSRLSFDTLCPSHGKPIVGGADKAFRERWPTP